MEHGIQIWVDDHWLWIPAKDREQAAALHQVTWESVEHVICRKAALTEDGHFITIDATS